MKSLHSRGRRAFASALLCSLSVLTLSGKSVAAPTSPFALVGGTLRTLTPLSLAAARKTETPGRVSADGKTLVFRQKTVRLVVVTGPDRDMLSYRIDGLRNPTLIVPRGATLKMLFVNTDDDMFHNIRFGASWKTYPNVMTDYRNVSVGTPELAHKSDTQMHGEELTVRAPKTPGDYVYLCTVRGHAQGGMVGKVAVQ